MVEVHKNKLIKRKTITYIQQKEKLHKWGMKFLLEKLLLIKIV